MAAALILEALVTAPPYIEPEESSSLPCVHLSSPPSSASSSPTPKMDTELEPTQRVVMIHTGNVRRCNHQVAMKPTTRDEIMTALKCTMHCWRKYHSDVFVLANEFIGHPKLMDQIDAESRQDKQITAKLFILGDYTQGIVSDAVASLVETLSVDNIDNFIVEMKRSEKESDISESFVDMWKELSEQRSTITNKGVVDFTTKQLAAMQDSGLELPQINQLEASRCRSVPRELRAMAKANGMKLLSHQDNGAPLSQTDFERVMNKVLEGREAFTPLNASPSTSPPLSESGLVQRTLAVSWQPLWVLRYNVVDSTRSVVDNLGYVICGQFSAE
eukprot:TRINITY_DN8315_c0_g1_i3.p1 TRINITY_DN8315_c0_g1~~TRINITY_DN8315_c0_g1_i3.p1  ORF type:complete len:331 (+),score=39.41 TRINITY_DN8315_c0_g1_i3:180-1172(+)